MSDMSERRHDPTPRKREQARAEGRHARSALLTSASVLCALIGLLRLAGDTWLRHGAETVREQLARPLVVRIDTDGMLAMVRERAIEAGFVIAPLLMLIALTSIVVNVAQVGFVFNPERLAARWRDQGDDESPPRWARWESWWLAGMSLLQAASVVTAAGWSIWSRRAQLGTLVARPFESLATDIARFLTDTCWHAALALTVVGALDYAWQRWRFELSLRMTDQELKEEAK